MAGGWWFSKDGKAPLLETQTSSAQSVSESASLSESDGSISNDVFNPLAQSNDQTSQSNSGQDTALQDLSTQTPSTTNNIATQQPLQDIDVASIAIEPLSDEEFIEFKSLMQNDVDLRLNLLEEFRYNTNPDRARQLAALLGPYNDPQIVQVASELAYSGNPQSQKAGLDLLSRLQPHSHEARDIAINLLTSESNDALLVSTMNVLATPTRSATAEQRQLLTDNLNSLSTHYDPKVRSHSLSLMGRWDKNSAASKEALTLGLSDTDPAVRASAAYAINNVRNPDESMINGLLAIAENSREKKATRFAALDALAGMPMTGTAKRRYSAAKINVNQRTITSSSEN